MSRTKSGNSPPARPPQDATLRPAFDYRRALIRALRIRALVGAGADRDTAITLLEQLAGDSPQLTLRDFLGALVLYRAQIGTTGYAFRLPTGGGNGGGTR